MRGKGILFAEGPGMSYSESEKEKARIRRILDSMDSMEYYRDCWSIRKNYDRTDKRVLDTNLLAEFGDYGE